MIDLARIRNESWATARILGYETNAALPLLDDPRVCRSSDEVVDRLFAMHCTAASAYGFDRRKALDWIERESKKVALTPAEREFLLGSNANRTLFMEQIEGIWALCWSLGIVPELDFAQPCSDQFVYLFPNLKTGESGNVFRERARLRDSALIVAALDSAYCVHWAVVNAALGASRSGRISPYVVAERRRALEWLCSEDEWADVEMDT